MFKFAPHISTIDKKAQDLIDQCEGPEFEMIRRSLEEHLSIHLPHRVLDNLREDSYSEDVQPEDVISAYSLYYGLDPVIDELLIKKAMKCMDVLGDDVGASIYALCMCAGREDLMPRAEMNLKRFAKFLLLSLRKHPHSMVEISSNRSWVETYRGYRLTQARGFSKPNKEHLSLYFTKRDRAGKRPINYQLDFSLPEDNIKIYAKNDVNSLILAQDMSNHLRDVLKEYIPTTGAIEVMP